MVLLASLGLTTLASVSPSNFVPQLIFVVSGLVVFVLVSNLNYALLFPFAKIIYTVSILALFFTIMIGIASRGATRWIELGFVRIQFSELLKPLLIVAAASLLSTNFTPKKVIFTLVLAAPIIFLIFGQPDLGTALVYFLTLSTMLAFSGLSPMVMALTGALLFLSSPLIWNLLADYQRQRIVSFLSPDQDLLGASYNAIQSVITVGSGMILGRGLGRGTQTHLFFLPERHTDFIFASFAEEFGFLGSLVLLAIYFFLFVKIISIFGRADSVPSRIVSIGVLASLFFPMLVNIAMNIGLLPITGVPLPLVSYGGSSFLGSAVSLGLVASIQRMQKEKLS